MKILIFTDDTGVKLPKFSKWKVRYSRGIDIRKDPIINSRLNECQLKIPSNDIENETQFKKVLHDFVRPAKQMYGGMFNEIRCFTEQELPSFISTQIFFISGRYGVISETQEIIPYSYHTSTIAELGLIEKKFDITRKIHSLFDENDIILFLLPKEYIEHLIKNGLFENMTKPNFIIVSSIEFRDYFSQMSNVLLLNRIGVARIGKRNRERIIEYIEEIRKSKTEKK